MDRLIATGVRPRSLACRSAVRVRSRGRPCRTSAPRSSGPAWLPALCLHAHGRRHVGPRAGQRGTQRGCRRLDAAQAFRQLGPELLVLLDQPAEIGLDLVKEGVNLSLVIAWPEPGRTELLVPHIRGRQRRLASRLPPRHAAPWGRRLDAAQAFRQLGPELLVLLDQPAEIGLDLVKEGVNLSLVIAWPEPGRTELLVPHIRGRQRRLASRLPPRHAAPVARMPVAVVVHGGLLVHRAGTVGRLEHLPGLRV